MRFARQNVLLLHMDPPKIGSDPDLTQSGPIQTGLIQFGSIWGVVWVRFRLVLGLFGSVFVSCFNRLASLSIRFGTAWVLQNLIRATDGMSIDR